MWPILTILCLIRIFFFFNMIISLFGCKNKNECELLLVTFRFLLKKKKLITPN